MLFVHILSYMTRYANIQPKFLFDWVKQIEKPSEALKIAKWTNWKKVAKVSGFDQPLVRANLTADRIWLADLHTVCATGHGENRQFCTEYEFLLFCIYCGWSKVIIFIIRLSDNSSLFLLDDETLLWLLLLFFGCVTQCPDLNKSTYRFLVMGISGQSTVIQLTQVPSYDSFSAAAISFGIFENFSILTDMLFVHILSYMTRYANI